MRRKVKNVLLSDVVNKHLMLPLVIIKGHDTDTEMKP